MINRHAADIRNLLSKGTMRRWANAWRVTRSYWRSRLLGKAEMSGMPIALAFEPTTSCNLRCPECPSGLRSFTRPTGMLEQERFEAVIDELAATLWYLTFYFQGEPYLHPQFLDMVRYASSRGIYTATSTNAHYLSPEKARETVASGLDRLIISIDGTTQETYEQYRVGGKLSKVLEGTANLIAAKKEAKSKTPYVVFQYLVVRPNEHQLQEARTLARELGVDDIAFKTAQIYDYEEGSPLIPTLDRYARYRERPDGRWEIKNPMLNHCWKMWHSAVLTWDGRVLPCCFDKDGQYSMGQAGESASFGSIWQNESYRQFRQSLLRSRTEIEMCQNCTEGTKVWG